MPHLLNEEAPGAPVSFSEEHFILDIHEHINKSGENLIDDKDFEPGIWINVSNLIKNNIKYYHNLNASKVTTGPEQNDKENPATGKIIAIAMWHNVSKPLNLQVEVTHLVAKRDRSGDLLVKEDDTGKDTIYEYET